jgi:DNA-binding GntR family transcriptional regulator
MDMKIAVTSVQDQVIMKLKDAIFTGVFAPGEKLNEPSLCRMLGVSRTSIREALRSLNAERLVTIIPNRGPMVTEITWAEADAVYQVRALLEGEAVGLFSKRAKPEDLAALRTALAEFEAATCAGDALRRVSSTARFYDVILQGCGNPIIAEIVQGLVARISFLRARSMSSPDRAYKSLEEMRAIAAAAESRNARAARAAAIAHVEAARAAARRVMLETQEAKSLAPTKELRTSKNS